MNQPDMKNYHLTKAPIMLWMCLFFSTMSFAGMQPGFLVTQEGDTLRGAFKFNMSGIKFKPEQGGKAQLYPLERIQSYAYQLDGIMHYNFENLFYSLTIDGTVQLYQRTSYTYSYNGQYTTTIVQNSYAVKSKNEEKLTLLRMTSTMGRGKMYFVDQASDYFSDFPELVADIQSGAYNKPRTIVDMVNRYNEWKDAKQTKEAVN